MRDVILSLVSSVIAGSAVWAGQRLLRYRRLARRRAFFGVVKGASCLLVSPRHVSSPMSSSVHSRDGAALVELATVVNRCGGRAELVEEQATLHRLGRVTEFCVGGPVANRRTAAHLRALLPGVEVDLADPAGSADSATPGDRAGTTYRIGDVRYRRTPEAGYVLLARTHLPDRPRHPVFLIAGQHSWTNLAAARYLASRYRRLLRRYGTTGQFCLLLKVREEVDYGPDFVEELPDVSDLAFQDAAPTPERADPKR